MILVLFSDLKSMNDEVDMCVLFFTGFFRFCGDYLPDDIISTGDMASHFCVFISEAAQNNTQVVLVVSQET